MIYTLLLIVALAPAPFLDNKPPNVTGDYLYSDTDLDLYHNLRLKRNGSVEAYCIAYYSPNSFKGRYKLKRVLGEWVIYIKSDMGYINGKKMTLEIRMSLKELNSIKR